jgi:hypothetical protein
MSTDTDRYLVGETVYLRIRVSVPGTNQAADPTSATLRGIVPDGEDPIVPGDTSFTRAQAGSYYLAVDTADLDAGAYGWVAELVSDAGTTLAEGSFVLAPPAA